MRTLVFISLIFSFSILQSTHCTSNKTICQSCEVGYFLTPSKKCNICPSQCDSCFLSGKQEILQCIKEPINNGTYSLTSVEGSRSLRTVYGQYVDLDFYYLQWEVWQIKTSKQLGTSVILNQFFSLYLTANCNGFILLTKQPAYEWIIRKVTYNVYTIKNVKCGHLYSFGKYVTVAKDEEDSKNILWVIKDFSFPPPPPTGPSNTIPPKKLI